MIKFFRKIRQKLLTENKFSKYLLYAIGEIVLVMIGILLALQVNNWNEGRKNNTLERGYIKNLIKDLNNDVNRLNEVITFNEDKLIRFDSILSYSNKNINALPDHDRLYFYTITVSGTDKFVNINRTLNQLTNLENGVVRPNVTDSISNFQQELTKINELGSYYFKSIADVVALSYKLINVTVVNDSTYFNENGRTSKPMRIKNDLDLQFEFFNKVSFSRDVTESYISDEYLKGQRQKTKDLIGFLETEYNFKQ